MRLGFCGLCGSEAYLVNASSVIWRGVNSNPNSNSSTSCAHVLKQGESSMSPKPTTLTQANGNGNGTEPGTTKELSPSPNSNSNSTKTSKARESLVFPSEKEAMYRQCLFELRKKSMKYIGNYDTDLDTLAAESKKK